MTRRLTITAKVPVAPRLLNEERLTFQRKIWQLKQWHDILNEIILNFDQTPLSYICTESTTLEVCGMKSVPIVGKQKKITGTFTGQFLPMQLIYAGKAER